MRKKKSVLLAGCNVFGILIITGSVQVVFSPYMFLRIVMLLSVVGCSIGIGAFIRELCIKT
ncbi:hypothetical protein [Bacillus sp. 165]|uniref:hypothetical protein n=1 Tax=Bacillus sp. 165 TaxID=1529117 RepID=UPI001ADC917C|nr:hypothetical protein [Bacillus sp. 165]MBO9128111.1 hypothetical protein [Bacillus sp. 165]